MLPAGSKPKVSRNHRAAVSRYTQSLTSQGAEPGYVDYWGKRRFAYEVQHRWEGYYVVLQAMAEASRWAHIVEVPWTRQCSRTTQRSHRDR